MTDLAREVMEVGWKRAWLWWKRRTATSSISVRLWWAAVPLMVVFGIVTLWSTKGSSNNLVFVGNQNPTWSWTWPSRSSSSASIMNITNITFAAAAKESNTSTLSSNVVEEPPPSPPLSFSPPLSVSPPPEAVEVIREIEKPVSFKFKLNTYCFNFCINIHRPFYVAVYLFVLLILFPGWGLGDVSSFILFWLSWVQMLSCMASKINWDKKRIQTYSCCYK